MTTARSGIARSGDFRSGDWVPTFGLYVEGVDRTSRFFRPNFTMVEQLDNQPTMLTLRTKGFTVTDLDEVQITYGAADRLLFGGHVLRQRTVVKRAVDTPRRDLECMDYRWLMDRYDLVNAVYRDRGINSIVGDILARFTNGGFFAGYVPQSVGNASVTFSDTLVSEALNQLASVSELQDTHWRLRPDKHVDMADDFLDANTLTLGSSDTFWNWAYERDNSQRRSRLIVDGAGSTAHDLVLAGATSIPIQDATAFSTTGGTARAGTNIITYTGISYSTEPETLGVPVLTGCSGITDEIPAGTAVTIRVLVNSSSAQTAIATLLGGSLSGVVVHHMRDGSLGIESAEAKATNNLNTFGGVDQKASWVARYAYPAQTAGPTPWAGTAFARPGKTVAISLTSPDTVSGTFRIQRVVTKARPGSGTGSVPILIREIQTSNLANDMITLFQHLQDSTIVRRS